MKLYICCKGFLIYLFCPLRKHAASMTAQKKRKPNKNLKDVGLYLAFIFSAQKGRSSAAPSSAPSCAGGNGAAGASAAAGAGGNGVA